jgi:LysR family transcriptional regulator, nitrogen assimilation regulatory protein
VDSRQLRYFAQVVESGSFSKAANVLHVAQPALSHHVRQMELELGVSLLFRSPNGVKTTDAGSRLMTHAKRVLAEFADIPDSVRGVQAKPRGDVRFGLPGTVSELLAVPLIEAAKERFPDVRIRVVEAMSGYVLDWLRKGEIDLAMIYATSDPRGIAYHLGLSEEICLFANAGRQDGFKSRKDTVRFSDIVALPLIVPGPGHGLRELIDKSAASVGASIAPEIEIDSYNQIKKLVDRGIGYGILPRMAIDQDVADGRFRAWHFSNPALTRKVYLAYSTERPLNAAPRAIAQLSWTVLRRLVAEKVWTASLPSEPDEPALFP